MTSHNGQNLSPYQYSHGAIVRGDTTRRKLALVFTGDAFADGGWYIPEVLKRDDVQASFFLTGNFYRNPAFRNIIRNLRAGGHYLGPHSDSHLLYCAWENRDSLLITQKAFKTDLENNYQAMTAFGIAPEEASFFLPPYEWYNDSIADWSKGMNVQLINFTPGTLSHADYTTPDMPQYKSSASIYESILQQEQNASAGLNGYILLLHIGTDIARTDKMYYRLPELIGYLKKKGYELVKIDELLTDRYK